MKNYVTRGLVVGALAMTLTAGFFIGQASARQEHMDAALRALQDARAELVAADNDKGGHRANAIGYVDSAIRETREGIDYARY